jgi:hypothetical protein
MKKPCSGWNSIPACVYEELGIRPRAFYSDRVSSHVAIGFGNLPDNRILARHGTATEPAEGDLFCRIVVKSGFANFDRVRLL